MANSKQANILQSSFEDVFTKMDISRPYLDEIRAEVDLPLLSEIERKNLHTGGVEIEKGISEAIEEGIIERQAPHNIFLYKKRPVFVYIRDMYLEEDDFALGKLNPFHLCYCSALKTAEKEHRFNNRYVVTNRTDGKFLANITIKYSRETYPNEERKLRPCMCCLEEMDWKGIKNIAQRVYELKALLATNTREYKDLQRKRWQKANTFNMEEFIEKTSKEVMKDLGLKKMATNLHTPYSQIRKQYWLDAKTKRERKMVADYCCGKCHMRFEEHELFIHHIDHNEGNNAPNNLLVVCRACHRAIHEIEGGVFIDDEM